jgi:hypothetical protein
MSEERIPILEARIDHIEQELYHRSLCIPTPEDRLEKKLRLERFEHGKQKFQEECGPRYAYIDWISIFFHDPYLVTVPFFIIFFSVATILYVFVPFVLPVVVLIISFTAAFIGVHRGTEMTKPLCRACNGV